MVNESVTVLYPGEENRLRHVAARTLKWTHERSIKASAFVLRCEERVRNGSLRKFEAWFLIVLVCSSFVLRIWGVSHVHVWDENVYLLNADLIRTGDAPYDEISSRPPLLSLLFAGAMTVWRSDYAAWVVATILNACGPLLLYLAGRRFAGRGPALVAALMLGFSPYMANAFDARSWSYLGDNTGHSLMTDCPALTMILLAFWLLLSALSIQSNWRFVLAGLGLASAVLMRFGSLSSVGLLLLLPFAAKQPFRAFASCIAGLALGLSPYLCWSRWRYGGFLSTLKDGWSNFDGPVESSLFFFRHAPSVFSWLAIMGLLIWACLALTAAWAGEITAPQVEGDRFLPLSSTVRQAYLVFWMLSLFVCFSSLPHKEPRYIVPAAAPLFLLSGIGWSTLFRSPRTLAHGVAAVLLVLSTIACFWSDYKRFTTPFITHDRSEEMIVSSYIQAHSGPETVLYAASSYPDFAYYAVRKTRVLPFGGPKLYQVLGTLPAESIVIAYKRYDDGTVPEPSLLWLDGNGDFTKMADFPDIALYRRERVARELRAHPMRDANPPVIVDAD